MVQQVCNSMHIQAPWYYSSFVQKWRSLSLFCIALLVQIGTIACAKHSGYNKTSSQHKADDKSYPLAALRDNVRDKIRIYGQFHTATTRHPGNGQWQVIDEFCSLYGANGRHEIVKAVVSPNYDVLKIGLLTRVYLANQEKLSLQMAGAFANSWTCQFWDQLYFWPCLLYVWSHHFKH